MLKPPEMVPPKFATPRNHARPTRGPRQARFAEIWFGRKFMPHQQYIADVAGELQPNGLPYYSLIVCTMQRRGGKTDLALAGTGERAFARKGFQAWYTAQTGKDARDSFLKFSDDTLADTALSKIVTVRRGNGHEDMTFPNASILRPHPPTEESLHGKDSDRNDIDEAWAFEEDQGVALMQAIAPTQLTRPGAQTFIWSAGGTAASTWLAGLVARGRAGATEVEDPEGRPQRMAYFEWGIPDDLSIDNLEEIARHHPAFGHTITLESFYNLREQLPDDNEWARAAGNRWTEVIGGVISSDAWFANRYADPVPADATVAYGVARSEDGSQVAIAAAAELEEMVVVEILDVLPSAWKAAETVNAVTFDGPLAVYPNGASRKIRNDLEDLDRELVPMTIADLAATCATIDDALAPRGIGYRQHPALDKAVTVAGKRRIQSGGWVWAVAGAGSPIATLEAATAALHALRPKHRQRIEAQPAIYFGQGAA